MTKHEDTATLSGVGSSDVLCREEQLRIALDKAAYALFTIKRMAPEAIREFAAKEHAEACKVLNDEA